MFSDECSNEGRVVIVSFLPANVDFDTFFSESSLKVLSSKI